MSTRRSGSAVRRHGGRSTTGCALLPARKMLIEAIGDLRELLELEDLLILPVLPLEQRHRSPR